MQVDNIILYQATTRDYKVGDVIEFGKERNYQAKRVFDTNYRINGIENGMPEMFLEEKIKNKKKLAKNEMRDICNILWNYGFSMRELGYEICRQLYYKDKPSRLTAMFLCEKADEAKCYLTTAQQKGKDTDPKVVAVKLKGNLFKTSNSFKMRGGKSIDEFIEQAHNYWKGVDENFANKKSVEYLFEGRAEIVEVIRY